MAPAQSLVVDGLGRQVWLGIDRAGNRWTERAQRREVAVGVGGQARVQGVDVRDRFSRVVDAEPVAQPELVRTVLYQIAEEVCELARAVDGMDDGAVRDRVAEGMEPVLE